MKANEPLLNVSHLTMRFGGLTALDNVDLTVQSGAIAGLIGPNGSGKSTLFNVLTGLYRPTGGSIRFAGQEITRLKPHQVLQKGIARTFQNIRLFRELPVHTNVLIGYHSRIPTRLLAEVTGGKKKRQAEAAAAQAVHDLLDWFGLSPWAYQPAGSLPYGLQRKVEIVRALAAGPKLLLLDEPAAGMNEAESEDLMALIRQVAARGVTILLVEHDMNVVMNTCSTITVLDHGVKIAAGTPAEVNRHPAVIAAYLGTEVSAGA